MNENPDDVWARLEDAQIYTDSSDHGASWVFSYGDHEATWWVDTRLADEPKPKRLSLIFSDGFTANVRSGAELVHALALHWNVKVPVEAAKGPSQEAIRHETAKVSAQLEALKASRSRAKQTRASRRGSP